MLIRMCSFFVLFRFFKWSTNLRFSSFCVPLVTFVYCKWKLTCVSHVPRWVLPLALPAFLSFLSLWVLFHYLLMWHEMLESGTVRQTWRSTPHHHHHTHRLLTVVLQILVIISLSIWSRHHLCPRSGIGANVAGPTAEWTPMGRPPLLSSLAPGSRRFAAQTCIKWVLFLSLCMWCLW